jgi:hypothetical protein
MTATFVRCSTIGPPMFTKGQQLKPVHGRVSAFHPLLPVPAPIKDGLPSTLPLGGHSG